MDRDIDYAAAAVKRAILEKFARQAETQLLQVIANERTISVSDGNRQAEGTRDDLLAGVRKARTYGELWDCLPKGNRASTSERG